VIEEPVSAFSLILKFWYSNENKTWQGEIQDAAGTQSVRFNGLPMLIAQLMERANKEEPG
jgi:hypothetical protein